MTLAMNSTASRSKPPRFVSYLRVSTDKQGARGLGIEAQRRAVAEHLRVANHGAQHLQEFVEVESGKKAERPELKKAMELADLTGATLIIAKLDRLSRDAHFLLGLHKAGVEFVACDLPEANRLTLTIMAAVAEHEREMIAERTRNAMAAAKARAEEKACEHNKPLRHYWKAGNPNGAAPLAGLGNVQAVAAIKAKADAKAQRLRGQIAAIRAEGITSAQGTARALNGRGILTARGKLWDAKAVQRLLDRLGAQRGVND